jgi:hypothetical protein
MTSKRHLSTVGLALCALLFFFWAACQKEPRRAPTAPAPPAPKKPQPVTLELPTLTPPEPLPAQRVVDIFYTSNVAGEAEPCG